MSSVSIIIPVYNGEKYLSECLESVLSQDVEKKEIICVDDGSTDQTVKIIKEYQQCHANIILISQKNQGAAVARNKALDVAQGEYIAFMDADDYYIDKTALRKMIEICKKENVNICGSFRTLVRDGEEYSANTWREEMRGAELPKRFRYIDYQYDYNYQCYVFNRDFIEKYNLRFPNLRRYQDPPFFVEAMWYAQEFMVAPVEMYAYRVSTGPMKYSFIQTNDTLKGILHNMQFAQKNGLNILFNNNLERLNRDFYRVINESITRGNLTALKYLVEIEELIQTDAENKEKTTIKVLEKVKEILFESQFRIAEQYCFPYDKISSGDRVAVYGAGKAGKELVAKINSMNYCSLIAWVDKNYIALCEQGYAVSAPDVLLEKEFDCLFVAVEKEEVFEEIKEDILSKKWNSGKEILGPAAKRF